MLIPLPPVDPDLTALGERLKRLRQARGLELFQLARAMGVSRGDLALAERGRARLGSSELHRATVALRLPMRLLFEETDISQLRPLSR